MLFLWIFGNNIEDSMGRARFLGFYLLGGIAAVAAQTLIDTASPVPMVGASGAVYAVLGAYVLLYRDAAVVTLVFLFVFFTVVELPALVVIGIFFLLQLLQASSGGESDVATFAHIGGFVFGLAVVRLLATRVKPIPPRFPLY